jgi:glycogen operon protein
VLAETATRIAGSSDLYSLSGRRPHASINFVTSHDGFTLADLVSYNEKHNEANGEGNRDGESHNFSWNGGVEGPTADPVVRATRLRQRRNFMLTLLVSQGVPMLSGGDEIGRTQQGNNNAYCHDSPESWTHWHLAPEDEAFHAFVRQLVALRAAQPVLRRRTFLNGRRRGAIDVLWLRPEGGEMTDADWDVDERRTIGILLDGDAIPETDPQGRPVRGETLFVVLNAAPSDVRFALPARQGAWRELLNTVDPARPLLRRDRPPAILLPGRSSAVFAHEPAPRA